MGSKKSLSNEGKIFPLSAAKPSQPVRIHDVHGNELQVKRLAEMGLVRNAQVQLTSGGYWGPVLVRIGDVRLALDRELAGGVLVERISA